MRQLPLDKTPYWDLERARTPDRRDARGAGGGRRQRPRRGDALDRRRRHDARGERSTSPIERSSWVALRILPSSHTNPVFVLVDGKPVRASRQSAEWCLRAVDQCWSQKAPKIAAREKAAAEARLRTRPPGLPPHPGGDEGALEHASVADGRPLRLDAPGPPRRNRARADPWTVRARTSPGLPDGWIPVRPRHVDQLRHAFVRRQLTEGEHRAFLDLGVRIVLDGLGDRARRLLGRPSARARRWPHRARPGWHRFSRHWSACPRPPASRLSETANTRCFRNGSACGGVEEGLAHQLEPGPPPCVRGPERGLLAGGRSACPAPSASPAHGRRPGLGGPQSRASRRRRRGRAGRPRARDGLARRSSRSMLADVLTPVSQWTVAPPASSSQESE